MKQLLSELSKEINKKPDVYLSNIVFFKKCLAISSIALEHTNDAFDLSKSYFENLNKKINTIDSEQFIKTTNIAYEKIIKKLNLTFLDVISDQNKKKCLDLLNNIETIPLENVKKEISYYIENLKLFAKHSSLSNSLVSSFNFLKNADQNNNLKPEQKLIAHKALSYLILKEDVLPDELGVFGIADDVFIIEKVAYDLGGVKYGEELLTELNEVVKLNDLSFYSEGDKLRPLNRQTQLLLATIKYSIKEAGRLNFIVPNTLPLAYVFFIDKFLNTNFVKKQNEFNKGDDIYFKIPEGYVKLVYGGIQEIHGENFTKLEIEGEGRKTVYEPTNVLNFAYNAPKELTKYKIKTDLKSFNKIRFLNNQLLPDFSKEGLPDQNEIIFLTQKNNFDRVVKELKPFRSNLLNIFKFKYFKRTYLSEEDIENHNDSFYEVFGNGSYEIKVASDAAVVKELIDESEDTSLTLICDNNDLGSSFLSEVSEIKLRKIKNIIFIYPQDAIGDIKNTMDKKFKIFYPSEAFSQMDKPRIYDKQNKSILTNFEESLFNSYQKPIIESENLVNFDSDELLKYLRSISKEASIGGYRNIYLDIRYLINNLLWKIIPFNPEEKNNLKTRLIDFEKNLQILNFKHSEKIIEKIHLLGEEIYELYKNRNLFNLIKKFHSENVKIFSRTYKEYEQLRNYLDNFGYSDVDIIYYDGTIIDSPLIVPVMPSNDQRNLITQTKFSKKVILNLTPLETQIFMRNSNKGNEWHNFLNHQNKVSFSNFNSVQRKSIPKAPEKIEDIVDKQKSNDFSNLLKKKLNENDQNNVNQEQQFKDIRVQISAKAFSINSQPNKFLLTPQNGEVIYYDYKAKTFKTMKTSEKLDDKFILIRENNRGDIYDEICRITNENYAKVKSQLDTWKTILINFMNSWNLSIEGLNKKLKEYGVVRNDLTIRGWLYNNNTIAPQYPEETFNAILDMTKNKNITTKELMTARDDVFKIRGKAYDEVIKYLPKNLQDENLKNFEIIPIHFPNANLNFQLIHIEELECQLEVDINKVWQIIEM